MRVKIVATSEQHREVIARLLRSESRRIRMAFLHIYDEDLLIDGIRLSRLLSRQLAANTKLTIIIGQLPADEKKREEVRSFLIGLEERGARVWINSAVHAKVLVVERQDGEPQILISSANLSRTALYHNYELGIEIDKPEETLLYGVRDFFNGILGAKQTRRLEEYVV